MTFIASLQKTFGINLTRKFKKVNFVIKNSKNQIDKLLVHAERRKWYRNYFKQFLINWLILFLKIISQLGIFKFRKFSNFWIFNKEFNGLFAVLLWIDIFLKFSAFIGINEQDLYFGDKICWIFLANL